MDFTEIETAAPQALEFLQIFLRLLCAMTVGTVIGTEREYSNRPAGMRTHILVALGACTVMVTGQMIFFECSALGSYPDPTRLPAQVISGVGFLGAGTILRQGANVKGLTTAASLWAVACLGIAAGAGYYGVVALGTVFLFVTLTIFEVLQNHLMGPESGLRLYMLETGDIAAGLDALSRHAARQSAGIRDIATERLEGGGFRVSFRADIGGLRGKTRKEHFLEGLASEPVVSCIRILTNPET